jgi:hypothetical protein
MNIPAAVAVLEELRQRFFQMVLLFKVMVPLPSDNIPAPL